MNESERMNAVVNMTSNEREMVMMGAAQIKQKVNETIAGMSPQELEKATIILLRFGNFTNLITIINFCVLSTLILQMGQIFMYISQMVKILNQVKI